MRRCEVDFDINTLASKINELKRIGEEIAKEYKEVPAVDRNTKRILASVRILELNISDLLGINK